MIFTSFNDVLTIANDILNQNPNYLQVTVVQTSDNSITIYQGNATYYHNPLILGHSLGGIYYPPIAANQGLKNNNFKAWNYDGTTGGGFNPATSFKPLVPTYTININTGNPISSRVAHAFGVGSNILNTDATLTINASNGIQNFTVKVTEGSSQLIGVDEPTNTTYVVHFHLP